MRVLHVIPSISPIRGGPSQAVLEMVQALRHRGVEAEIATTNDNGFTELDLPLGQKIDYPSPAGSSVPVYCFPRYAAKMSALREFTFSAPLTHFLTQNLRNYDLLHVHAIFSYPSTAAMAIARTQAVPYITRPIGQLCEWSLTQSKARKQLYLSLVERANLQESSGLHFTSLQEQQEAEALNLNAPSFVIPHGLEITPPIPDASQRLRAALNLPGDEPILLFMSRLHPKKGLDHLIPALAKLRDQRFTFVLAGSGDPDYEAELDTLLHQVGLADRTQKLGFVTGEQKQLLLQGADLYLLTSYSENFGVAVLEALASGTPALVTPGVALSEVVRKQELGWVCDLDIDAIAQAIRPILNNQTELQTIGDRARQVIAAQYSWDTISAKLESQYLASLKLKSNSRLIPSPLS